MSLEVRRGQELTDYYISTISTGYSGIVPVQPDEFLRTRSSPMKVIVWGA